MFLVLERIFLQKSLDKLIFFYFTVCFGTTVILTIWNGNFLDLVLKSSVEFIDFLIKLWNSKFWESALITNLALR